MIWGDEVYERRPRAKRETNGQPGHARWAFSCSPPFLRISPMSIVDGGRKHAAAVETRLRGCANGDTMPE
jgi:hypothetical protein